MCLNYLNVADFLYFQLLEMELCPQETQPKDENLETLEELSRELKQISDSYFEMQGKILRMLHSDNSTS